LSVLFLIFLSCVVAPFHLENKRRRSFEKYFSFPSFLLHCSIVKKQTTTHRRKILWIPEGDADIGAHLAIIHTFSSHSLQKGIHLDFCGQNCVSIRPVGEADVQILVVCHLNIYNHLAVVFFENVWNYNVFVTR
jgi:hypothetical protein